MAPVTTNISMKPVDFKLTGLYQITCEIPRSWLLSRMFASGGLIILILSRSSTRISTLLTDVALPCSQFFANTCALPEAIRRNAPLWLGAVLSSRARLRWSCRTDRSLIGHQLCKTEANEQLRFMWQARRETWSSLGSTWASLHSVVPWCFEAPPFKVCCI